MIVLNGFSEIIDGSASMAGSMLVSGIVIRGGTLTTAGSGLCRVEITTCESPSATTVLAMRNEGLRLRLEWVQPII